MASLAAWVEPSMSFRRASLTVAFLALVLSACALRPRYRDVVSSGEAGQAAEGQTLTLRVVDAKTGQPIKGAKVLAGTGRTRLAATSDEEGRLSVPVSKALLDENPLVEVVLPKGAGQYRFELDRPASPPAPEAPPAPPAEAPAGTDAPATPPATPPMVTSGADAGT